MQQLALLLKRILPSPFSIALILTGITLLAALLFTGNNENDSFSYGLDLLLFWEGGLWQSSLLVFAFQMMLMLVLGHVLALSEPVDKVLQLITDKISNGHQATLLVTFVAIAVGLFNWGLALIVGAVFARKVGEHAFKRRIEINYPLIGAAGYAGLLAWHGGISGSSLTKVAEIGHVKSMVSAEYQSLVPESIQFDQTVFSSMNIAVSILLLIVLPTFMYIVSKRTNATKILIEESEHKLLDSTVVNKFELDRMVWFVKPFGILLFIVVAIRFIEVGFLGFFNPNRINLLLLALVFLFHQNAKSILTSFDSAISGSSGILLQFPLYFGIMGIANHSGLLKILSEGFVSLASADSLPFFTFVSAAIVNVFVPSGGGQWVVQGPIILDAVCHLQSDLSKNIMALAYGDQLTNMMQPFWALPLLGITGLKAREILPYTLLLMIAGATIFLGGLMLF